MRTKFSISIIIVILILVTACGGGGSDQAAANPTEGTFKGSTSQGNDFTLVLEAISGKITVTSIQYKVKMKGDGWSATIDYIQPLECQLAVKDARFMGTIPLTGGDPPVEISGVFYGDDEVQGRLKQTKVHPQGLGSGIADITFSANRTSP